MFQTKKPHLRSQRFGACFWGELFLDPNDVFGPEVEPRLIEFWIQHVFHKQSEIGALLGFDGSSGRVFVNGYEDVVWVLATVLDNLLLVEVFVKLGAVYWIMKLLVAMMLGLMQNGIF